MLVPAGGIEAAAGLKPIPAPPRVPTHACPPQVTLLSCGRLMYTGICDGLVEFFHTIGFDYDANLHGVVSDWALDLVACGSHKPKKFYGNTITSKEEVRAALRKGWEPICSCAPASCRV
jgi:hypothetical protein